MGWGRRRQQAPTSVAQSGEATFQEQAQFLITAEVRLISGCHAEQTSVEVPAQGCLQHSKAGGACTNALLDILKRNNHQNLTIQQLLLQLRQLLKQQHHEQIPQLSASRPLDTEEAPISLRGNGRNRALLIGINYRHQSSELKGCHNDIHRVEEYLKSIGFTSAEITILLDDGRQILPTRQKIILALQELVAQSQAGDHVYVHYSGHGGLLLPSPFSQKLKPYDETLIPVDHGFAGHIRDFHLYHHFVRPMPAGVVVNCVLDCCHSGRCVFMILRMQWTN